jgi:hypothetical protein
MRPQTASLEKKCRSFSSAYLFNQVGRFPACNIHGSFGFPVRSILNAPQITHADGYWIVMKPCMSVSIGQQALEHSRACVPLLDSVATDPRWTINF